MPGPEPIPGNPFIFEFLVVAMLHIFTEREMDNQVVGH
jgi:hypothetical protein